jgi:hypothetical protein
MRPRKAKRIYLRPPGLPGLPVIFQFTFPKDTRRLESIAFCSSLQHSLPFTQSAVMKLSSSPLNALLSVKIATTLANPAPPAEASIVSEAYVVTSRPHIGTTGFNCFRDGCITTFYDTGLGHEEKYKQAVVCKHWAVYKGRFPLRADPYDPYGFSFYFPSSLPLFGVCYRPHGLLKADPTFTYHSRIQGGVMTCYKSRRTGSYWQGGWVKAVKPPRRIKDRLSLTPKQRLDRCMKRKSPQIPPI